MSSILPQVYALLDAMTVTYTDKSGASVSPTCYSLGELKASVQTADLPARLLLPIGLGASGAPNITLGPGNMAQAQWQIVDLFLLAPVTMEQGFYIYAPVLTRYCVAYAEAIANKWQFLYQWQTEAQTNPVSILPGIYEYPAGSGIEYFGVQCTFTVNEVL